MNDLDTPISPDQVRKDGPIQVSNVMKDDFGFEIPVESVPLPSRGIIYPDDGVIHGCDTIDIKPMTAREEDILTSRAYIKSGTVLTKLLESCIIDKRIKPDSLISGDRNALLVSLRITGYGADYDVEVDCPECGTKSKQSFNLADLEIKRLEVEPVERGQNLFEVKLPVTKKNVRVKFLTGSDERDMMITSERRKKSGMKIESAITDRLSRSVVSVEGVSDKNKINFFVKNLPARDSLALRRFLDKHEPGIIMKSWMSCPHCHEQSEVGLPMGAAFFWPDTE
tara:strand:- start:2730 stop:3575 length:846 start_codon:yes stop_codon:yes gene_type:complete